MFSISATCSSWSSADLADDHRHAQQAGDLRGPPPALARDDLVAIAAAADQDRLDDPVDADRLRQLFERPLLHLQTRLPRIRDDAVEVDLERHAARGGRGGGARRPARVGGRFGDQGAQATPERGSLLSHTNLTTVNEIQRSAGHMTGVGTGRASRPRTSRARLT